MKLYKKLLVVALAAMPAAALQAQTYNDTVRTNTWTMYGAGGVSGYHGFRGGSDTGVRTAVAPDFSLGVKYNIKPWVRVGLNLGYTKIKAMNQGLNHTQTVTNNYPIGAHNDGVLTTDKVVLVNRNDLHLAGADLNADFNILELFQKRDQRWNLWLGTGVGYYHGWNRNTVTTAVSEEAVAKGEGHFNVFNHNYITTTYASDNINTLYFPARLSVEYDITPRWTIGAKGEYKCMPLDKIHTPKGMWSANLSIAFNFVNKRYSNKSIKARYEEILARMNAEAAALQGTNETSALRIAQLESEVNNTKAELDACRKNARTISVNNVFYDVDKTKISKSQLKNVEALAQLLEDNPKAKVYIRGYASTEGPSDHNNTLADKRAKAVADMLINEYNIAPERISTEGCGATDSLYKVFELNRVAVVTVENLGE